MFCWVKFSLPNTGCSGQRLYRMRIKCDLPAR